MSEGIPQDDAGNLLCAGCFCRITSGGGWGWVYKYGSVALVTCNKTRCHPSPPWSKCVRFTAKPARRRLRKASELTA